VGNDYLALLVHGVFLAAVSKPAEGSVASPGDTLSFVVRSIEVADGMLSMKGELCPPGGRQGDGKGGKATPKRTPGEAKTSRPASSSSSKGEKGSSKGEKGSKRKRKSAS